MNPSLLALFVVVPLATSALAALVRVRAVQVGFLVLVPLLSAAGGVGLLLEHRHTPVIATQLGGFPGGIAIPFASDTLAAVMITVTSLVTAIVLGFARRTGEDRLRFFPALALMLLAGVNGGLLTGDIFNLFVFVEVMLLPSYALLAMTGTWRRLGAGRTFLVVNLVTSSVFLVGIALVYAAAGTVTLASLAGAGDDPRIAFGVWIVLLALAIKAGAVPVHGWLPSTYPATSATVMALFASLHSKVALVAMLRLYAVVFGESHPLLLVVAAVVIASILVGSWSSFGESTIRRTIAFQMVAGVGHILVAVLIASAAAYTAGLIYMVHHILTVGVLVLAAGAIEKTYGTGHLVRLAGLLKREKLLATIMALALLSIVGFPPSSGFWGKVSLVVASAQGAPGVPPAYGIAVIGAIVVASIVSLLAMQRLWHEVFWGTKMTLVRRGHARQVGSGGSAGSGGEGSTGDGGGESVPLPGSMRIPAVDLWPAGALLMLSLVFFVLAGPIWQLATKAAATVLDPSLYVQAVLG